MLDSPLLQMLVFPLGALYLALHVGPLLRLFHEPSIRGGTRWRFFTSEIALSLAWLVGSPAVYRSPIARAAVVLHVVLHVAFTAADYLAHDGLLAAALSIRRERPVLWVAKEMGLAIDTATHAVAVAVAASSIGPLVLLLSVPALGAYAWVTRGYLKTYGARAARAEA